MDIPHRVIPRKDTGLTNSKIAIWLFLASEVMLFGGLFSGYIFLRVYADYPWPERVLPILPGLVNTFILIASSVTVVFAWAQLKLGNFTKFRIYMVITLLCAAIFMGFKVIEYKAKFDHQGIRLNDYTILEGHTHKGKYDSHGHIAHLDENGKPVAHHGEGHGAKDGKASYGEKEYLDKIVIDTDTISFDILSCNKGYLETLTTQAKKHGAKIKFAEDVKLQTKSLSDVSDFFSGKGVNLAQYEVSEVAKAVNKLLFDKEIKEITIGGKVFTKSELEGQMLTTIANKGDEVTYEAIKQAKGIYVTARGKNKEARTQELRRVTKVVKAENPDLAGWKRADLIKLDTDLIADQLIKQQSSIAAKSDKHLAFYFKAKTVKDTSETSLVRKDGTRFAGKLLDSPMEVGIDAVDFTFLVQQAEAAGIDPDDAIEKSWILKKSPQIKAAWEKHKAHVAEIDHKFMEEALKRADGDKEKAREITNFVPDVERYRMTWKDLIRYGSDGEISLGWANGFKGADHKNKEWAKYFYDVKVPRDQIKFESRFTPRWNNYYAIYFTITALHGLHIIGGGIVLGYYIFCPNMFRENPTWLANRVEVAGLFWHLVDLVWIFLFPILYLM